MKQWRRWCVLLMAVALMILSVPLTGMTDALAGDVQIYIDKIPNGKTGKNMTVSFTVKNTSGRDIENLGIGFDITGGEIWDEDEEDREYGYAFPFEVTGALHGTENPKDVGSLKEGQDKKVSISARVRKDLTAGYYKVPVVVMDLGESGDEFYWIGAEDIRVWISVSSGTDDDDEDSIKTYDFVLGEGQSTPDGTYPHVMNFSINLRNNSPANVYNVKASMAMDADTDKFPFEINDVNYDRMFEKIAVDETVPLNYSFAIREDAYSGYYPIGLKIYYSDSSSGEELTTFETSFYVRIHNRDKEDEYGEFNEHDREKARIIVDGFTTEPSTIVAGDEFDLILQIKNASNSISASNILFSLESEKVSDSAVFVTDSGASSVAMDSLRPGDVKELRMRFLSKPGVDQRSYAMTIKAKFDSPEFKNAEESMVVDIPVKQIPRLNTGNFEIMPESIAVGEESNVMFSINNTGKVVLYNVMASLEDETIQPVDTYVGNIKPGETGNVDCMVMGMAPTTDDGKIRVVISYEDENGQLSTEEREVTLYVTEDLSSMEDLSDWEMNMEPVEEPGFLEQHQGMLLPAALAVIAVLVLVITVLVIKMKKSKADHTEVDDDEIF